MDGDALPELRVIRASGSDGDPLTEEKVAVSDLLTDSEDVTGAASSPSDEGMLAPASQQALIDDALAESLGIARELAEQYGLPLVDLPVVGIDPEAARVIPLTVLQRVVAIPFAVDGPTLRVAVAAPQDVRGLDELRLATRQAVDFAVAAREDILAEIRRLSRASEALDTVVEDAVAFASLRDEAEREYDLEVEDGISAAPLVRLVNSIIFQAAEEGASDVHFEPREDVLAVRFRIDGVLRDAQRIPKRLAAGVTTRLKVLAKLDIAERRRPQDGRISLNAQAAGRLLDIRVATLPTVEGEAVTMRLLDKSKTAPTLGELGLTASMREQFDAIVSRPTGALLVTGPTGSGKSTTLYAALAAINRPELSIITVEDPVEYRIASIKQVQINVRAGLTFATALRSILRADPNVVMVGEIRDGETAKISIEAALTGHLVLSTLHTNDAPSALTRLNEMGVEPFITGAAVSAVLAQRLARMLCRHCAEPYAPAAEELARLRVDARALDLPVPLVFYAPRGCARCSHTGYRGRVGIFQLLEMSESLEQLAAEKASHEEIAREARSLGMGSLWDDGVAKVARGLTSVDELFRVLVA
jgi:type IV pilus assembly protein PilB